MTGTVIALPLGILAMCQKKVIMRRKLVKGLNFAMISDSISNGPLGNQFLEMNFFKSGFAREDTAQITSGYLFAFTLPFSDEIFRLSMGRIFLTWRLATSTLAIFLSKKFTSDTFQGNEIWDAILRSPAMFMSKNAFLHKVVLYRFYYKVFSQLVGQYAFHEHDKLCLLFHLDLRSQFLSQNHPT